MEHNRFTPLQFSDSCASPFFETLFITPFFHTVSIYSLVHMSLTSGVINSLVPSMSFFHGSVGMLPIPCDFYFSGVALLQLILHVFGSEIILK